MSSTSHHPKALPFLFLTEMWERFGFYTVQGLLVLYMTKSFGFTDDQSFTVMGVFTALVYISPFVGGFLADRVLGFKTAIVWGGLFLVLGYGLLASPFQHVFYPSLAIIILGNGLFKPNISSLLGTLYEPGDAARDVGFTIFYIGINIGVLLSGCSGFIKDHFGWQAAFGSASVGLIIGLLVFALGIKIVGMRYPFTATLAGKKWLKKPALLVYFLIAVVCLNYILQIEVLAKYLLPVMGIVLLVFVLQLSARQEVEYRQPMFTLVFLILSSIIFWGMFLQLFSSTTLFIDRLVDKHIFGIDVPTTIFYALESVFVILLGPIFAWSWQSLNQSNRNPSPVLKFVLAIVIIGLGFITLSASTYFAGPDNMISPLWIVLSYLLITIGELLLSPIGLSAITLLSPPHLVGMMMGIWFVATGFGGLFAGAIAKLSSVPATIQNTADMLPIYRHAFSTYGYLAFGVAVMLLLIHLILRKSLQR